VAERLEFVDLPGVRALNERDVRCTTVHPTSDFLNILALPFATPAPVESLRYAPGSPELDQCLLSSGPYALTRHTPGEMLVLERNVAWNAASDSLRAAYVDRIEIRQGLDEAEAHRLVASGEADMLWDVQPLTEELPRLLETEDPRLEVWPAGLLSPYLVINFASPANGHVLRDRRVREALQYAVDKAAVSRIWGGARLNDVADQLLPPLCASYRRTRVHATDGGRGDPDRSRRLLASAGHPDGVELTLVFRDRDIHPETAEAVGEALVCGGFRIRLEPVSISALFDEYFSAPTATRSPWDLALTGWEPDWYGNNARTYLQPLVDSRGVTDDGDWGANFGHYRNETVNALLSEALASGDEDQAGELFRRIEFEVLRDCAIVPILFAHQYWFHARRVRHWLPYPVLNGDLTNLWLCEDQSAGSRAGRGSAPAGQ
jgi:peptide/nickel transport system substrate-binding protein